MLANDEHRSFSPTDSNASVHAERRTVHFSGHVQGVGFRYTVQNISLNFDVRGYVKNLPNGQVLLAAEGPAAQLDEFVESIRDRMGRFIRRTDVESLPPTGEFNDFSIRQ